MLWAVAHTQLTAEAVTNTPLAVGAAASIEQGAAAELVGVVANTTAVEVEVAAHTRAWVVVAGAFTAEVGSRE